MNKIDRLDTFPGGCFEIRIFTVTKRLFNFDKKYSKTVQNRYLTIIDYQKSFIAKKNPTFLERVKTVISKKREIVQKSRKV